MAALLEIRDLDVHFATPDGDVHAVKKVSLDIAEGECLGVVGESGSGKSQLFLAAMGLAGRQRPRHRQRALSRPANCWGWQPKRLNQLRGAKITMIFQDPLTSLTPHMTVGAQIIEALTLHQKDAARRGRAPRAGDAGLCPHSRRRAAHAAISARIVRRHAPAGDDRHGDHHAAPIC